MGQTLGRGRFREVFLAQSTRLTQGDGWKSVGGTRGKQCRGRRQKNEANVGETTIRSVTKRRRSGGRHKGRRRRS